LIMSENFSVRPMGVEFHQSTTTTRPRPVQDRGVEQRQPDFVKRNNGITGISRLFP
jgi:hypothetical protein